MRKKFRSKRRGVPYRKSKSTKRKKSRKQYVTVSRGGIRL